MIIGPRINSLSFRGDFVFGKLESGDDPFVLKQGTHVLQENGMG